MRMDFDLSHTRAAGSNTILPPGEYSATIRNAELKTDKNGENFINVWFQIDGPSYAGAIIFERLNLWSSNPNRVEMSLQHLKGIRDACGLNAEIGGDTEELIGKTIKVKLGIREYNGDQYQSFKSYRPNVAAAAAQAAAQSAVPQAKAATGADPYPW